MKRNSIVKCRGIFWLPRGVVCAQQESSSFIILYKISGGEGAIEKVEGTPEASKVTTKEEGSGNTVKMAPTEKQPAEFQKALQDFIEREKKTEGMTSVIEKIISDVLDKMSGRLLVLCRTYWAPVGLSCWIFIPVDDQQMFKYCFMPGIVCANIFFYAGCFLCIESCQTKCPDMLGIFRDDWYALRVGHLIAGEDTWSDRLPWIDLKTPLNISPCFYLWEIDMAKII